MNTERDALLAAARSARDDDDAPRLALADWLADHGEPDFAQLIRLESERERLPTDHPRWRELNQACQLLRRSFPGRAQGILTSTRRGLIASIQAGLADLGDGIETIGPYSPRLKVLLSPDYDARQDQEEAVAGGNDWRLMAMDAIFRSRWVRLWEVLEIQRLPLTAEWVRAMLQHENLQSLRLLCLSGGLDDGAVRQLAQGVLPSLTALQIHEVPHRDAPRLTPDALAALADSPLLAQLEELAMLGTWYGREGLCALAASLRTSRLKSLILPLGGELAGLTALIESPHLLSLQSLDLSWSRVPREILQRLANPDRLPALSRLTIGPLEHTDRAALERRFGEGLVVEEE